VEPSKAKSSAYGNLEPFPIPFSGSVARESRDLHPSCF
jgi:hypothetical protein